MTSASGCPCTRVLGYSIQTFPATLMRNTVRWRSPAAQYNRIFLADRMSRMPMVTAIGGMAEEHPPAQEMLWFRIESDPSVTTLVLEFRSSSTDIRCQRESGGSLKATWP